MYETFPSFSLKVQVCFNMVTRIVWFKVCTKRVAINMITPTLVSSTLCSSLHTSGRLCIFKRSYMLLCYISVAYNVDTQFCPLRIILLSCYTTACYSRHFEIHKKREKEIIVLEVRGSPEGPLRKSRTKKVACL